MSGRAMIKSVPSISFEYEHLYKIDTSIMKQQACTAAKRHILCQMSLV